MWCGSNALTSRFHKTSFWSSFFTLLAKSAFVPYIMRGNITFGSFFPRSEKSLKCSFESYNMGDFVKSEKCQKWQNFIGYPLTKFPKNHKIETSDFSIFSEILSIFINFYQFYEILSIFYQFFINFFPKFFRNFSEIFPFLPHSYKKNIFF